MKTHLDERPYECKLCASRFHTFVRLKRHCREQHEASRLLDIVDYHNSRFSRNRTVRYVKFLDKFRFVELIYREEDAIQASTSKMRRPQSNDAETTVSLVVSARGDRTDSIRCDLCNVTFTCSAELLCHIWLKHMCATQLICWLCSIEYHNQSDLVNHLNDAHLSSELRFIFFK